MTMGLSMTGSQMGLGMGMSMGMSGGMSMGMSGGMGAGATDEERRKRLEKVIETLRSKPGRVSDEGIERLAQRCSMAVQCDPPVGKGDGDGVRQLAIAGETLLIEVQLLLMTCYLLSANEADRSNLRTMSFRLSPSNGPSKTRKSTPSLRQSCSKETLRRCLASRPSISPWTSLRRISSVCRG
jgi:hypothetical protein